MASVTERAATLVVDSIYLAVLYALTFGYGIALIVMGALHLDDCAAEPRIPILAIVAGGVSCYNGLIGLAAKSIKDEDEDTDTMVRARGLQRFGWVLTFCTWVAGQVIALPCLDECYTGCVKELYQLVLVFVFSWWAVIALGVLVGCCSALSA